MKIKNSFAAPFLLIVVLMLQTLASLLDPADLGLDTNLYLTIIILELLVYALPAVFFCRLRGREYGRHLRVRLFRPNHIFFILLALLALLAGNALIRYGMHLLFPDAGATTVSYTGVSDAGLYAVLAFCILPAAAEEFLFRGILVAEYEKIGAPFAVLVSALCFGMMHLDLVQLPAYFYSGVILALVLYATRSLFASMAVHIGNNIAALWTEQLVSRFSEAVGQRGILLVFILVSVLMITLVLFFMEAERIYRDYGIHAVPSPHADHRRKRGESSGALEALTTPPFVAFIVMTIVFTLFMG